MGGGLVWYRLPVTHIDTQSHTHSLTSTQLVVKNGHGANISEFGLLHDLARPNIMMTFTTQCLNNAPSFGGQMRRHDRWRDEPGWLAQPDERPTLLGSNQQ